LTPFISGLTAPLYTLRKRWFKQEPLQTINLPRNELQNHVVIAGCGRIGTYVARILKSLNVSFVVIEFNSHLIHSVKESGLPLIYGDASQLIVLEAAKIETARLLIVTTPSAIITKMIVELSRSLNSELRIVARAESEDQMRLLHALGASEVIQPGFETSLEITRQALLALDIPATEIVQFTDKARHELYASLYQGQTEVSPLSQLQMATHLLEVVWFSLPPDSPLTGRTIQETGIRGRTGASVVGVLHGKEVYPNPDIHFRFSSGDFVAVMGNRDQIEAFNIFCHDTATGKGE
jgi:CPA2 family monovalent cation:H+ antiporter-2